MKRKNSFINLASHLQSKQRFYFWAFTLFVVIWGCFVVYVVLKIGFKHYQIKNIRTKISRLEINKLDVVEKNTENKIIRTVDKTHSLDILFTTAIEQGIQIKQLTPDSKKKFDVFQLYGYLLHTEGSYLAHQKFFQTLKDLLPGFWVESISLEPTDADKKNNKNFKAEMNICICNNLAEPVNYIEKAEKENLVELEGILTRGGNKWVVLKQKNGKTHRLKEGGCLYAGNLCVQRITSQAADLEQRSPYKIYHLSIL